MKRIILFTCILTFLFTNEAIGQKNKDIELLRQRFINELLDQPVNEQYVKEVINNIQPDGSWAYIDYKDTSRIAFQHTQHLSNLVQMSRAYNKKGSSLRGNRQLKKALSDALDFWLRNDFICENWWNNEIGTPNDLTAVLLMMDKGLSADQIKKTSEITFRANINAWGARPSGDRIKIIGIQAKNALFQRDISQFEMLMKEMGSEIKLSTDKERGIQHDLSFHHRTDRVNNTLSYGSGYAEAFAEWAAKVADTRYRFSDASIRMLTDYYLDGMCKQMAFGKFADPGIANRDIARPRRGIGGNTLLPERLLQASSYRKEELEEIIRIRKENAKPTKSFGKFFWQTEHYVHQRPDYYTSVRMFSTRNRNMEEPYNGEGLTNHHRADGTNYLTLTGNEYLNIAPVNDWQKIPGTTVLQKPSLPGENQIQKEGMMDFVGAVTDGLYGAVGFDFISPHDGTRARKSWFFFDEEYVCLGAGIQGRAALPVVTTLNQCFLEGDVTIGNRNTKKVVSKGEHVMNEAGWVFHSNVGYILPDDSKWTVSNRQQTGSWFIVNRQTGTSREEVRKDIFKLWVDHGNRPSEGSYEYIVLPATTVGKVADYAVSPKVRVLSNTPSLQAVWNSTLDILQIVCYAADEISLGDLTLKMDSPGIIMVKGTKGNIREISVADPSRKLSKMHFRINKNIDSMPDDCITYRDDKENMTGISINLPQGQYAGQSVTIVL